MRCAHIEGHRPARTGREERLDLLIHLAVLLCPHPESIVCLMQDRPTLQACSTDGSLPRIEVKRPHESSQTPFFPCGIVPFPVVLSNEGIDLPGERLWSALVHRSKQVYAPLICMAHFQTLE